MRFTRRYLFVLVFLGAVLVLWHAGRQPRETTASATARKIGQPAIAGATSRTTADGSSDSRFSTAIQPTRPGASDTSELLRRLAYAQAWNDAQPPALAAFRDWTERYQKAATPDARVALEAEGVALARTRRPVMHRLIVEDPAHALALTVPATIRQALPADVLRELETRIAGKGDYAMLGSTPNPELATSAPPMRRIAFVGGVTYTARAYGRRQAQLTLDGISLHGVALDGDLALHESPLRVLEPGEIPAVAAAPECPVTNLAVPPLVAGAGVNADGFEPRVAEANGRVWEFCGTMAGMLESFEKRLLAAEAAADPTGAFVGPDGTPRSAADALSAWTTGPKKTLVIRVDFSDFPGEPVTAAAAQDVMDNQVRPFLEGASYGQATVVSTVSSKVYRMPQTVSAYAIANNSYGLHADARALAGADYAMASYDRVIVSMTRIDPAKIPGSQINASGLGDVVGPYVWVFGSFIQKVVCHELGHTYGLWHGNLWQVTDGNPVSSSGTSVEYGDPFDVMGHSNNGDVYNPWSLNRLGWLPDSAVTTVTKSGTYRVYRFDSKNASFQQPLALRIARDGVRTYWVGYRQSIPANASVTNGAYILWGFNGPLQSQLLDLTTSGVDATDAALPVGATLDDPVYGIKIKTMARGGSEPAQYLDMEVTMPATPVTAIIAWPNALTPESTPPAGLINVRTIAAGDLHGLALKDDGTVAAWGVNSFGQATVPAGLSNVVAVAAGGSTSGALKSDGTIVLWGDNSLGQLNVPPGLTGVRQLAVGPNHILALKTDGTVVAWGEGRAGQTSVPGGLRDVIAVAAGAGISMALKADGTVVAWGQNGIAPPAGLTGVVSISCQNTELALKADGTVVAWGANNIWGQATVPAGLSGVIAIAQGSTYGLALKADGTVVGWGDTAHSASTPPPNLPRLRALAVASSFAFALGGSQPVITSQPESESAIVGGNVTFTAHAAGSGVLTYQWRKNGIAIIGATGATLTFNNVQATDTGLYSVLVSDGGGYTVGTTASLLVSGGGTGLGPDTGSARLANLSTRAVVGTGGDILIPGIAITGSGEKQLVVRASGPALGAQGVSGTLARPQLRLYSGQTVIAENIGWSTGGTANTNALLAAFSQVGLSAFPVGSADCALIATVGPGGYTATISGVGDTKGAALVEVYELGTSGARLAALSCRARVGTGSDALIPGITIAGTGIKRVIIRASGPALTLQGVDGALAKPQLEIYGESGKIAGNIGWSTAPNVTDLMLATAAVGLGPYVPGSADCAVLLSLPPGNYTAKVAGLSDTTGVALVEVYEVP